MTLNLVSPTWGISGEGNEEITRYIMCCQNPGGSSSLATTTTVEATAKPTTPQPSKNPTNSPIPKDIDAYELEDIGYEHNAETSWGCIFSGIVMSCHTSAPIVIDNACVMLSG